VVIGQRGHGLPETPMVKRHELRIGGKTRQRRTLPGSHVIINTVDDRRLEYKESTIDPGMIAGRFFLKRFHGDAIQIECAIATGRQNGSYRSGLTVFLVELDERPNVDVCQPVAVSKAESLLTNLCADALQPATSESVLARIDERDTPRLDVPLMNFHRVVRGIKRHIGHVEEVVS